MEEKHDSVRQMALSVHFNGLKCKDSKFEWSSEPIITIAWILLLLLATVDAHGSHIWWFSNAMVEVLLKSNAYSGCSGTKIEKPSP